MTEKKTTYRKRIRFHGVSWYPEFGKWRKSLAGKAYYLDGIPGEITPESALVALEQFKTKTRNLDRHGMPIYKRTFQFDQPKSNIDFLKQAQSDESRYTGFCQHIQDYLSHIEINAQIEQLSVSSIAQTHQIMNRLIDTILEYDIKTIDESAISILKQDLASKMQQKKLAFRSVQTITFAYARFIKWCWRNNVIDQLPRNIDDLYVRLAKRKRKKIEIKVFSEAELVSLFAVAVQQGDTFMEMAMLMGLTCGYYQQDISDIRTSELVTDDSEWFIERHRSKSGMFGRHYVSKRLQTLIEANRASDSDTIDNRLFIHWNRQRQVTMPYCYQEIERKNTRTRRYRFDHIRERFCKIKKWAGVNSGSFSTLRKSGGTWVANHYGDVVAKQWLCHSFSGDIANTHYLKKTFEPVAEAGRDLEKHVETAIYGKF